MKILRKEKIIVNNKIYILYFTSTDNPELIDDGVIVQVYDESNEYVASYESKDNAIKELKGEII